MTADIQPLDYETCRKIVVEKLSRRGMRLSDGEINQIATESNGQPRHIEGRLNKLEAERDYSKRGTVT